ncbi:esterase FrsA [Utexia brackfieldae]|uniref:esterase FrsA n=1 Tax=Utexia brackfieldae TaxID=3074108 RepID=UPI00370D5675
MTVKNLSEKLFKPKFNYPETSALIQRFDSQYVSFAHPLEGQSHAHWYRVLNSLIWHQRGLPLLEIDAILARIAASDKKRSNPQWLDSVIGYQSGNWIYEFAGQASQWQQQAEALAAQPQTPALKLEIHQAWLNASQFCSLASYPHFKTDDLASQAQVFGYRAYREALNYSPYTYKEVDFTYASHTIKGLLHLPAQAVESACPIVFMCSSLANLQIDFYRYFAEYLAPQGIGLLTIDGPGVGLNKAINLTQNSSDIHQAVLQQLVNVPWVDHHRVILAGFRFGGHIATRLSYIAANRIKGVFCIAPFVHQLFVDKTLQDQLPIMYKDLVASRLGLVSCANEKLAAELNYFSLKNQGLLGRPCSVPVMSIVFDNDLFCPVSEAKLLTSTKSHKLINVAASPLQSNVDKAMQQSVDWMINLIK